MKKFGRLYFRHEPTDFIVEMLSPTSYPKDHPSFFIPEEFNEGQTFYLCVVVGNQVYAGRSMRVSNIVGAAHKVLRTDTFTDTATGKQIILKHWLKYGE